MPSINSQMPSLKETQFKQYIKDDELYKVIYQSDPPKETVSEIRTSLSELKKENSLLKSTNSGKVNQNHLEEIKTTEAVQAPK